MYTGQVCTLRWYVNLHWTVKINEYAVERSAWLCSYLRSLESIARALSFTAGMAWFVGIKDMFAILA
jgi:hypothetical protein